MNMATLERAIEIAVRAHSGQRDKQGMPYILHPLRVMMAVQSEDAKIVAVLHDILEDTSVTEEDLRKEGFSEVVIAGILGVTRRKHESYTDFVIRASQHELSREVKLADLADNSSLSRILLRAERIDADLHRVRRYLLSYRYLTAQLSEAEYRQLMNGA
jgi:(p)ppGpp synthase/HD superfamily hydrolase